MKIIIITTITIMSCMIGILCEYKDIKNPIFFWTIGVITGCICGIILELFN